MMDGLKSFITISGRISDCDMKHYAACSRDLTAFEHAESILVIIVLWLYPKTLYNIPCNHLEFFLVVQDPGGN